MDDSDPRVITAAWQLQVAVHGLLSARVIADVDTYTSVSSFILSDRDHATIALAETRPVLTAAGHDDLCERLDRVMTGAVSDAGTLLDILDALAALTGGHLDVPLPRDGP